MRPVLRRARMLSWLLKMLLNKCFRFMIIVRWLIIRIMWLSCWILIKLRKSRTIALSRVLVDLLLIF